MKRYAAFTLAEMLVVMIVTGIIFLTLFEGIQLVERFAATVYRRIERGNDLLEGYRCLDALFQRADSIREDSQQYSFFREDEIFARIVHEKPLLLRKGSGDVDTLFRQVEEWECVWKKKERMLVDSMNGYVLYRGKRFMLSFGLPARTD